MASSIDAITSGVGGVITTADNTGILELKTAGNTAVTVDTSQNVGIGTTSPTNFGSNFKMLAVQGSDFGVIQAISNSGSTTIEMMGASGTGFLGTRTNHPLALRTNDTERMRIDSSGNLLVGTTSNTPSSGTAKQYNLATGTTVGLAVSVNNTGYSLVNFFYNNATNVGTISTNGTGVTYGTSSDYRLKENIVPMTGALDKIAQLKPVTYTWKQDGSNGQGFIAHELQAIVPDCVSGEKDDVETYTDEEGNEQTRPKYQGVDTSFLVATLTAAIQEQQTIINDLKARITALEGASL